LVLVVGGTTIKTGNPHFYKLGVRSGLNYFKLLNKPISLCNRRTSCIVSRASAQLLPLAIIPGTLETPAIYPLRSSSQTIFS